MSDSEDEESKKVKPFSDVPIFDVMKDKLLAVLHSYTDEMKLSINT